MARAVQGRRSADSSTIGATEDAAMRPHSAAARHGLQSAKPSQVSARSQDAARPRPAAAAVLGGMRTNRNSTRVRGDRIVRRVTRTVAVGATVASAVRGHGDSPEPLAPLRRLRRHPRPDGARLRPRSGLGTDVASPWLRAFALGCLGIVVTATAWRLVVTGNPQPASRMETWTPHRTSSSSTTTTPTAS